MKSYTEWELVIDMGSLYEEMSELSDNRDANGDLLKGDRLYRLHVLADVPVSNFWSATAYSRETKSFIYNDLNRVELSRRICPACSRTKRAACISTSGPNLPQVSSPIGSRPVGESARRKGGLA